MPLVTYKRRAEGLKHEGETFLNLDLRSMKAFGSTWKDCIFKNCQLDLADMRNSSFENCEFQECSMRLVDLSVSVLFKTDFAECDMEQASLAGTSLNDVAFLGCRMAYGEALFQNATVKGPTVFSGCNLHGSNLDFREVPRKTLSFTDCNLWSAKLSMGCQFWNGLFDDTLVRQFLAMLGRASGDARIAELAGDQYAIVCRAMDGRPKWDQGSTTSPATGSPQIQNSAVPMDQIAIVTTPTMLRETVTTDNCCTPGMENGV